MDKRPIGSLFSSGVPKLTKFKGKTSHCEWSHCTEQACASPPARLFTVIARDCVRLKCDIGTGVLFEENTVVFSKISIPRGRASSSRDTYPPALAIEQYLRGSQPVIEASVQWHTCRGERVSQASTGMNGCRLEGADVSLSQHTASPSWEARASTCNGTSSRFRSRRETQNELGDLPGGFSSGTSGAPWIWKAV